MRGDFAQEKTEGTERGESGDIFLSRECASLAWGLALGLNVEANVGDGGVADYTRGRACSPKSFKLKSSFPLYSPGQRTRFSRRGFTLIELTISAAIGAIVLVASYLCLSAGLASQKLIEPRMEVMQTARVAMAMMTADLRSACSLSPDFDFVGEHREVGDMEADNLDFATHSYIPARPREGDYCQVSYFADKGGKSEQFSLWRRRNPRIAPDPLDGGSREEIAKGLRGLKLEFYDGYDWYDSWGDTNPDKKQKNRTMVASNLFGMPEAVKITLMLEPPSVKKSDAAKPDENPPPPFVFQSVVRLEWTDATAATASGDTSTNSGTGSDSTPPGQNNGNGGPNQ